MADDSANQLVNLIREIVREEIAKLDRTSIGRINSVNNDGTVNLVVLPDTNTQVNNVLNGTAQTLKSGDLVVLYKINNNISNAFVITKYGR